MKLCYENGDVTETEMPVQEWYNCQCLFIRIRPDVETLFDRGTNDWFIFIQDSEKIIYGTCELTFLAGDQIIISI